MTTHDDMTIDDMTTLVLGGTGKTGRRVAQRLAARGHAVRIGSRRGAPPFSWEEPATWDAVLDGAQAVYLAYAPDLAFPGAVDTLAAISARAAAHGAQRLVLLSGRGEEGARASEQAVAAAGAPWTVVRAAWFDQNFSEHFLLDAVTSGVVALPAGDVVEPFVDADDVADVAVAALLDPGHDGVVHEVTGPRLLSFADAADEIAAATRRPVRYVSVSPEEYVAAAIAAGVPEDEAAPLAALFTEVLDGRNAYVTDGVARALGRPPIDFRDYARRAAASGVWDAPATAGAAR
jgi:uncharacterized protein YbjT (DUF2867 family)